MKVTIEFNLPDEKIEYELFNDASKMHSVLWEMDQWLRSQVKYPSEKISDDEYKTYEKARAQLHEFMGDHNFNFD
jgi:hypothetical protein